MISNPDQKNAGFSLLELCIVLAGAMILAITAVPTFTPMVDSFRLVMAAETVTTQFQFARMKAVSSNETFRVSFPGGGRTFQVETGDGTLVAGPFQLPTGINLNTVDTGTAITFGGNLVSFTPTGTVAAAGAGSAGRVKIMNRQGSRVDIVVSTAGAVRQTPVYRTPPAAF
jgi:Tfp pilus assembly protein FimT